MSSSLSPLDSNASPIAAHDTPKACEHKELGNNRFRARQWHDALTEYMSGLACLPSRPAPETVDGDTGRHDQEIEIENKKAATSNGEGKARASGTSMPLESEEVRTLRATLYANIAACKLKLDDPPGAVEACTEALADDPKYAKALQRRATANSQIGSWSALQAADDDYAALVSLQSSDADAARARRELAPRLEAARKKETDEMMGKFKDLGNTLLGKFGLSTDNFKFEPNGQGGYSMNFVNK